MSPTALTVATPTPSVGRVSLIALSPQAERETILEKMADGSLKNCIYPGEFAMIKDALEQGYSPDQVKVAEKFHL